MTHAEIAALVLEENYSLLFGRLLEGSVVPEGEQVYWRDAQQEGTEYDKWFVNAILSKPSIAAIEAEFDLYKSELTAAEDARLLEIARVAALQARWDAIPDIRMAMVEAGLDQPNSLMLLKEIIDNNDEVKMTALESAVSTINAQLAQEKLISKAAEKRLLGLRAIDLMAALNDSKGLTGEQVGAMLTALEIPNKLLSSGSIGTAIGYITAMALPANVTEGDRTQILDFLTANLISIEAKYA